MTVAEPRHRSDVGQDAGDVRGRREAADLERPVLVADQLFLEVGEVDAKLLSGASTDDAPELAAYTALARVLLNLDETLTKE